MTRFLIFTLLLISNCNTYAQTNGYIEYFYEKNLGVEYTTIGVLRFDNSTSEFIELLSNQTEEIVDTEDSKIISVSNSSDRPSNLLNLIADSLYSSFSLFKSEYVTKEKKPNIKWVLKEEFKQVNTFKCQLAEGKFRGRKYFVWFTQGIPVPFGPWKLQGLPGLILEATDDKKEISFAVKSIKIGLHDKFEWKNYNNAIELKTFVALKKKIYSDKEKGLTAKMPRNASFKLNLPSRTSQKEVIYEWEVENE